MKHLGILLACVVLLPLALLDEYRERKLAGRSTRMGWTPGVPIREETQ